MLGEGSIDSDMVRSKITAIRAGKNNVVVYCMDDGSEIRGMIYIMKLIRNAPPQRAYYQGIADAYRALGLSRQVRTVLVPALERSLARG